MKTAALVLGLTLVAGSSPAYASAHSDFTKSFPLGTLKTFAFQEQRRISREPLANNDIWANDVRTAIREDLSRQGFTEVTDGHPDVYVAFYVGLEDRYDLEPFAYGAPVFHHRRWWGWPGGYDVWAVPYTQSTLTLDLIDAKTNQLVWRGYDNDTLNAGNPEKTLDSAVDHILSRLTHDVKKSHAEVL